MSDDEKKEDKKASAGTLIGIKNPPAVPPAAPAPAPEPTHLTLKEVADDPAPVRPVTQPQPLEPVMPAPTEAQVQEALNRVATPAPSAKAAAPPKAEEKRRLIRIAGQDHDLLHLVTGAIIVLFVSVILVAMIAALVNDSISHHHPHLAAPIPTHLTRLLPAPPVLICDEQSVKTVTAGRIEYTGCHWFPPRPAGTVPKTLYCDDSNHPTDMPNGKIWFTDCKPK